MKDMMGQIQVTPSELNKYAKQRDKLGGVPSSKRKRLWSEMG
jgi:hypothetical protein